MPADALTLATYPCDPIRLACPKCGRVGQYRRATLAERFGPDAAMPAVLSALAACPRRGQFHDPCAAIFPDLIPSPKSP